MLTGCMWAFIPPANAQSVTDSLLNVLNNALANKNLYVARKQDTIKKLKDQLLSAKTSEEKYSVYSNLYNQYKSFNYDSAYSYAKKLQATVIAMNRPGNLADSKMKLAFTLLSSGLFKETFEELNSINVADLPSQDKIDYYFLKARSYFDLSDYNRNKDFSAIYNPKGIHCIDSAMVMCTAGTFTYFELRGLKDLRTSNINDGIYAYRALLALPHLSQHDFAVNACCLSYIYEAKGEQEKSIDLLIRASIADIQSATKETIAIYKVADALYKKGDIKDSYIYIQQAMDDATYYGALQREARISSILPIIEAQWVNQIEHQRKLLYRYSVIITLLVIAVLVFAFIIFRQLKKLRVADEAVKAANSSLQQNNIELAELNSSLNIANRIKNEYIGYYFNVNSIYIEKLENFRKSLEKKLSNKRYEDAMTTVKNLNLESERQQLFHTFDQVFLQLFPDFIKKVNELFYKGDEIVIPEGQLLGTEHRIFALIRIGIHDNDRIAKLLGYSVNTIYSYKNRIKNRSFVPNDEFEDRIMLIEAV